MFGCLWQDIRKIDLLCLAIASYQLGLERFTLIFPANGAWNSFRHAVRPLAILF
jgi:hypothetical protein